jgi:hypothetical protein
MFFFIFIFVSGLVFFLSRWFLASLCAVLFFRSAPARSHVVAHTQLVNTHAQHCHIHLVSTQLGHKHTTLSGISTNQ